LSFGAVLLRFCAIRSAVCDTGQVVQRRLKERDTATVLNSLTTVLPRRGGVAILDEFAGEWRRLCDETSGDPFCRPEWIESYVRAFEPDATLVVISVWRDGRLRALLPLILDVFSQYGIPIRRLRFPGNVHCCRFDLARCAGVEGEDAVRSIWGYLKETSDWDVLDVRYTPQGGGVEQLQRAAKVDGFLVHRMPEWFSLSLPIEESQGSRQSWMAGTSQKFRANVRRTRRQIDEFGQVRFFHCTEAVPEMLSRFYELERSGWKGKQGTAIACSERTRDFYNRIATNAARHGYLSLDFLEIDGRPICGHLAFRIAGRYYLAKILQQSYEWGLKEFDFTGPATWDESRWTSKLRGLCRIYVFQNHRRSRLLYGQLTFKPKLKRALGVETPVACELLSAPENASDAFIVPEGLSEWHESHLSRILKRLRLTGVRPKGKQSR
jgi:hypothetical protein